MQPADHCDRHMLQILHKGSDSAATPLMGVTKTQMVGIVFEHPCAICFGLHAYDLEYLGNRRIKWPRQQQHRSVKHPARLRRRNTIIAADELPGLR